MIIKRILDSEDCSVLLEFYSLVEMELSIPFRNSSWLDFKLRIREGLAYGKFHSNSQYIAESICGDYVFFLVDWTVINDPPEFRLMEGRAYIMNRQDVAHIYAKQICGGEV